MPSLASEETRSHQSNPNFFANPNPTQPSASLPSRARKPLPFPLADPFADDSFQLHDPHGYFSNKKRRASSSAHSASGAGGSQDSGLSGGDSHSREPSAGSGDTHASPSSPRQAPQGLAKVLGRMQGLEEGKVALSAAETAPAPVAMDGVYSTPANEDLPTLVIGSLSSSPRFPLDSSPATPETNSPQALTIPIPMPTAPTISELSPQGRNPFHRLRIGSSGSPPPFVDRGGGGGASSPQAPRVSQSPGGMYDPSDAWEASSTTSNQTESAAASFLSTFSPDSRSGFGSPPISVMGDQQWYKVYGYTLGRELGAGAFGLVREATRDSDGDIVAVKIIRHHQPDLPAYGEPAKRKSVGGFRAGPSGIQRHQSLSATSHTPSERSRSASNPGSAFLGNLLRPLSPTSTVPSSPSTGTRDSSKSSVTSEEPPLPQPFSFDSMIPSHVQTLLEREILVWQQLTPHPHILTLLGVHHTKDFSYIFMPLCSGGNLLSFINDRVINASRRNGSGSRGRRRRDRSIVDVGSLGSTLESDEQDGAPQVSGGLPLSICRSIFAQIVSGLHYLHTDAGVTHKDLKLENILCDEPGGTWKIADFGLAEATNVEDPSAGGRRNSDATRAPSPPPTTSIPSSPSTRVLSSLLRATSLTRISHEIMQEHQYPAGSLPYCAPEQMKTTAPIQDPSLDIWSLGCILYALVDGRLPMQDDFEPRLRMKILKGTWEVPSALQSVVDPNRSHSSSSATTPVPPSFTPPTSAPVHQRPSSSSSDLTSPPKPREEIEKQLVLQVLRGCLEPDPTKRWTIDRVRSCDWLASDQVRGRAGYRSRSTAAGAGSGSSRSPSVPTRRKERSTSRGAIAHYAVDPRTRSVERKQEEKEERKMRWQRDGRTRRTDGSRSASRGTTSDEVCETGSSTPLGTERLGQLAEPY